MLQALGPPEPPSFPLDPHVMPAISQRMSLALQLDAHLRKESKAEQEASWKQRTAAELDLDVSDGGEPDPREAPSRSRADPQAVAKLQRVRLLPFASGMPCVEPPWHARCCRHVLSQMNCSGPSRGGSMMFLMVCWRIGLILERA